MRLRSLPFPLPCARAFLVLATLSVLAFGGATEAALAQTRVVISQVYGGGGNSGATYRNDFVELFNPTAATVTLTGYSLQYGAATSTGAFQVFALPGSVTLQPGQFYLVQAAAGSGGTTNLPAPDATIAAALSSTAGKVALVSSLTAVTGCPTADATVVDFVGFGGTTAAVNCSLGSPAPLLSNTTAAVRTGACSPTNNNASDFAAQVPTPHNSVSTSVSCAGAAPASTPLTVTGLATGATVFQGGTTLLTATVTPGTVPLSTGVAVSGDLGAIGGSATQPFYDDGTHGDVAAGDNVFSYAATVPGSVAAGSHPVPVHAADGQLRSATATIALAVAAPPPSVTIRQIQSAKPSPYAAQQVLTTGVVVAVTRSGVYLEAADADTMPTTPEGVLVYTGSTTVPSFVAVGAQVQVTGTVSTYPPTSKTPATEIDGPQTFALISGGHALPTPVVITAAMDLPTGGLQQFARYEGMRVAIGSLTTTSGTGGNLNEAAETTTSTGQFYGVVTGVPRPFREPGLSVAEPTLPAGANVCPVGAPTDGCVPQWDANPELIQMDTAATGAAPLDVTSNVVVTGISGVMDFSSGAPRVIVDRATRPVVTSPLMTATPVPAAAAGEFTVASFNMERFYNDQVDGDNPGSSVVKVTTEAYQRRLAKASLAVRTVLNSPDVIGTQEIENLSVLTDLANRISVDATAAGQVDPVYKPYLFLATDGTGINAGMLVKSTRVNTVRAEQFGLTTTFTNAAGNQAVLNDRTPLVVHVGVKRPGLADYPVTVISVHQRSLINVDDTTSTGATVRLKREAQAEYLATLIQGYQAAGEHVVTVGDYNAFEFSDGYVDALGVTKGAPVPATQVLTPPVAGLARPPLVDLVTLLPAAERQSYVESGSAQVLDHVLVTPDLAKLNTRLVYAHMDSDFPLVYLNDATRPERVSDHDPAVAYFRIPAPMLLSVNSLDFGVQLVTTSQTRSMAVTNGGDEALTITSITVAGTGYSQRNNCPAALTQGASCVVTVTFVPAAVGTANGTVTLTTNSGMSPVPVPLTGAGGDVTVAATPASTTVVNGGTANIQVTVTSVGGYGGPVTLSCSGTAIGESCVAASGTLAVGGTLMLPVTVSTTAQLLSLDGRRPSGRGGAGPAAGVMGGFTLAGLLACVRMRRFQGAWRVLALCLSVGAVGMATGCDGASRKPNPNGTPSGTQTITLTAMTGGVSRTATVMLTVK